MKSPQRYQLKCFFLPQVRERISHLHFFHSLCSDKDLCSIQERRVALVFFPLISRLALGALAETKKLLWHLEMQFSSCLAGCFAELYFIPINTSKDIIPFALMQSARKKESCLDPFCVSTLFHAPLRYVILMHFCTSFVLATHCHLPVSPHERRGRFLPRANSAVGRNCFTLRDIIFVSWADYIRVVFGHRMARWGSNFVLHFISIAHNQK